METQVSQFFDLFSIIVKEILPSSQMIINKFKLDNDQYYYFDTNNQINKKIPNIGFKSEFYVRHDMIYFRYSSCVRNFFGIDVSTFNKLFMVYGIKIEETNTTVKNPIVYYGYNDNYIKMAFVMKITNPWDLKLMPNSIDMIRLMRITYTDIQCRLKLLEKYWHQNIDLVYDQMQYLEDGLKQNPLV